MIKFQRKHRHTSVLAPTTHGLAQIIKEDKIIPVPMYSDKVARDLIIRPRGIIFLHTSKKKKSR